MSVTNGIGNSPGVASQVTPVAAPAAAGKEQQIRTTAASTASVSRVGDSNDHANISSTSGLISTALSGSDVRLDKVRPLQEAIANGTYHVASSDVADKLIGSLIK